MSNTRHFVCGVGATLLATIAASCSNIIPMAADHGPIPLDSARAVAIAQRNVCGSAGPAADSICIVRTYQRTGNNFVIGLERRPPAGNDRLAVTLRDHGMVVHVAQLP